jgi:hypothetical protein
MTFHLAGKSEKQVWPTRNSEALQSFVQYCEEHPEQRFWQALRNWSKWRYIVGTNIRGDESQAVDTFYLEGLDGTLKV